MLFAIYMPALATLKNSSGEDIENDKEKADALAEQYCSVFSKPTKEVPLLVKNTGAEINDFQITEDQLLIAIKQMNMNTSPGLDNFPSILLKKLSTLL